jgi:hypothetical protein
MKTHLGAMTCGLLSLLAAALHSTPARAQEATGEVTIQLRSSDKRAVLERRPRDAGWDGWEALCVAPCRATVDIRDGLRVAGSGIDPLGIYPDGPGSYDVTARTASAADETAGFTMVMTGLGMMVLGGIGVGVTASQDWSWSDEGDDAGPLAMTLSLGVLGVGAAVFGIGAALRFGAASGAIDMKRLEVEVGDGVALGPQGLRF